MRGNILKMSFLLSYLTILVCVVSGIPFMTAVFRSIILMVVASLAGFLLRWYLLNVVTSVEQRLSPEGREEEEAGEEEPGAAESILENEVEEPVQPLA